MMQVFWVWFNLFVNKLGSVSPGGGRKLIDSGLWISYSPRCQNTALLTFSTLYYVLFFCCITDKKNAGENRLYNQYTLFSQPYCLNMYHHHLLETFSSVWYKVIKPVVYSYIFNKNRFIFALVIFSFGIPSISILWIPQSILQMGRDQIMRIK